MGRALTLFFIAIGCNLVGVSLFTDHFGKWKPYVFAIGLYWIIHGMLDILKAS